MPAGTRRGRVERAIRYIRDSFFAGRSFSDLADLNAQAEAWCQGIATDRRCPGDRSITVREAFQTEQGQLMTLPEHPYPTAERMAVRAGKTPYVRFDSNDYSIPHTHLGKTLTVFADHQRVRIIDGQQLLANHPRRYDRGAQVEDDAHLQKLVEEKQNAQQHRATDRLLKAIPLTQDFLCQAADRVYSLPAILRELAELRECYRTEALEAAMRDALNRAVPHPNAVRLALARQLENSHRRPPVALPLSPEARARDVTVRPHPLGTYDQLSGEPHESD